MKKRHAAAECDIRERKTPRCTHQAGGIVASTPSSKTCENVFVQEEFELPNNSFSDDTEIRDVATLNLEGTRNQELMVQHDSDCVASESCAVSEPSSKLPETTQKPKNKEKVKRVRFAPGPIGTTNDGHPSSHSCPVEKKLTIPSTPIFCLPTEALTRQNLTAMEDELGEEFRAENAASLVRLKRRAGLIPMKPIPRPFANAARVQPGMYSTPENSSTNSS